MIVYVRDKQMESGAAAVGYRLSEMQSSLVWFLFIGNFTVMLKLISLHRAFLLFRKWK